MGTPENKVPGFVGIVKSWIPRRSEPSNLSRDFWMPDQSCRVCYECDSQFTVFNRRHHCRICGRVFCGKCASNSIPAPSDELKDSHDELERIRVCNFCFKQREHGIVSADNGVSAASLHLSSSPSARSLGSSTSSCTCNSSNSTIGSIAGPYLRLDKVSVPCPHLSHEMDSMKTEQENATSHEISDHSESVLNSSLNQVDFFVDRSDDERDEYGDYRSNYRESYSQGNDYYRLVSLDEIDHVYEPHEAHDDGENINSNISSCLAPTQDLSALSTDKTDKTGGAANDWNDVEERKPPCEDSFEAEPVDFESNGLLWLPPEPENEEDEREAVLLDDYDDDEGTSGEYLGSSNSFGYREYHTRDKSIEEHRTAMKNVVEGHFRALIAQLLEVENLPMIDESDREGWLDIITSLCWDAATLLKPDTSKSGGMDPGGYVKVKCIPCGRRRESMVVRGIVCKKNVAHRRMTSKIDKPRLLLLGGALEYQRISNQLSSFHTLLQQEMDHLKMAVAKIDSHNPDLLLVEKSVSRHAQEYLLEKDISLVLNIKRSLLERIARCTGAQIVPSIDHLTTPKLGYCDLFRVEKFIEEHVNTGQDAKKLTKTLMFFEGCPKPLGFTILLKGAQEDELKKVKHVVQYGVFAAYHLALETSFLADEGASLPELPLRTPITVALPDKPSKMDRSISTIPGFAVPNSGKPPSTEPISEAQHPQRDFKRNPTSNNIDLTQKAEGVDWTAPSEGLLDHLDTVKCKPSENFASVDKVPSLESNQLLSDMEEAMVQKNQWGSLSNSMEQGFDGAHANEIALMGGQSASRNEMEPSKEEFPLSPSNHQSILVSLSTRCVRKGSVCERAHLLRIKYYGSFDKPLGRFLRDDLFDQDYRCLSCGMPSEAHVHCYTHRQGSLTISVKKLPESLRGEREGKIWMWHRCLRCPRVNGFPPATRRIVMSDAAWGLSFGKFLELSFSNHAAASRVANCGHSLHRDCLRFYGFGRMVACFRYASINVYSVYLPPPKVEFNYDNQEWIQNEVKEVIIRAEVLFAEVEDALRHLSEKAVGTGTKDSTNSEAKLFLVDLEGILEKRKKDFKESVQQILLNAESKAGKLTVDILEINKLRRLILFDSYAWDERLTHVASLIRSKNPEVLSNSAPKFTSDISSAEKLVDMNVASKPSKGFSGHDSLLQGAKHDMSSYQGESVADISDTAVVPNGGTEMSLDSGKVVNPNRDGKENSVGSQEVVRRLLSEDRFRAASNLYDTLDAAWIGKITTREISSPNLAKATAADNRIPESTTLSSSEDMLNSNKGPSNVEHPMRVEMPYPYFYHSFNKDHSFNPQKQVITENQPVFVSSYRELEWQSGARLLLPVGLNDTVVPVYDDEPTSAIAYVLASSDYNAQVSESDKSKDSLDSVGSSYSLLDSVSLLSLNALGDLSVDISKSLGSTEEQVSQLLEPLKVLHARVSFTDEGPLGKVKYTVTCYYAKRFSGLRRMCCSSEMDFIRSLSRCKKWGAQGGKSNVFFAKTLDDRFIIKQVTKTELESFIKFGPAYFKYLSDSINSKSPTCLAKILGIYQISSKHLKGGKEFKMDVLVMENLLFKRNVTRLYDLKGSSRARYNPDTSGSNKVLLDQNLIEAMLTSPIFVGSKAKRLLERAVWNDTSFLASIDVMDYSLLVGVDEERNELVLGIIDFMRQYTWDKHLETWVKTSGLLGGPKNTAPTVISPQQYKKRFRKAMTTYFLMVPDQWSPPTMVGGELKEEKDNPQERSINSS